MTTDNNGLLPPISPKQSARTVPVTKHVLVIEIFTPPAWLKGGLTRTNGGTGHTCSVVFLDQSE